MENKKQIPEETAEPDLFDREEQCQKAIRVVRKAVFMRILVALLMAWALLSCTMDAWVWGLMAFVILIDVTGMLPLLQEWKKQRKLLKELIASEEQ